MANPDIAAAEAQALTHLAAAGAALTDPILDTGRGLPTGGRMLRFYWGGECPPPHMDADDGRVLNGQMVGQVYEIVATWPLSDLSQEQVTVIDGEMQELAVQIRTKFQADNDLGDHIESLDLDYAEPTEVTLSNARHVALRWQLRMGYLEYAVAK